MRLGTRGSRLAMAQAQKVRRLLEERGANVEIVAIRTTGDVHASEPLHAIKGGVGAFVREVDEHLMRGEIDAAVHSLKDVPTARPPGLATAAVLRRESACDVAVTRNGEKLSELKNAVVGTSSTRRTSLVRRHYPHLAIKNIRGNVDTRIGKLRGREYDAILLAEAGLIRLGIDVPAERLDPYEFVPSANQGVIAVVARPGTPAFEAASMLNDGDTWLETRVERIITSALDGGCVVPMGAYAKRTGDSLDVVCEVLSLDGARQARVRENIPVEGYEARALKLAEKLAACGGKELVEAAKVQLRGHGDD